MERIPDGKWMLRFGLNASAENWVAVHYSDKTACGCYAQDCGSSLDHKDLILQPFAR